MFKKNRQRKSSVTYFNLICLVSSYDSSTGVFTVSPGGDGVYYFSIYVLVEDGEYGVFDIELNDDVLTDHSNSGDLDLAPASCSGVVNVVAGDAFNTNFDRIWNTQYYLI